MIAIGPGILIFSVGVFFQMRVVGHPSTVSPDDTLLTVYLTPLSLRSGSNTLLIPLEPLSLAKGCSTQTSHTYIWGFPLPDDIGCALYRYWKSPLTAYYIGCENHVFEKEYRFFEHWSWSAKRSCVGKNYQEPHPLKCYWMLSV